MGRFLNPDNTAFQTALNSEIYIDKTELLKFLNKKLSEYVNDLIENRSIFLSNDMKGIEVIDNEKIKQNYYFIPFIIDSDVVGSIIMFSSKEFDENSKPLLLIASKLLVNYIE